MNDSDRAGGDGGRGGTARDRSRRAFVAALAAVAAGRAMAAVPRPAARPVRIGLTAVFLDEQVALLRQWREYFEGRLGRPVAFVQRGSYREIVALLRQGEMDLAWVCGFPFVRYRRELRLLAVPVYRGEPLYRSYLVVPAADRRTGSLLDLRGRVFAFSDPDSNSGFLYPTYRLLELRERPEAFFGKTFFAWAHRKVVEAVASGLAHGGAVDGYVWDTLERFHPALTARTRVVDRSPAFGFPPFVARAGLAREELLAARSALVEMGADPAGRALLDRLNLDGFTEGDEALFDGIARMARTVRGGADAAS